MSTSYRESSFLERLGKTLGGVLAGILLLLFSCGLLWWNEGDFVRTREALAEALAATEELGDVTRVQHDLDGHMVHARGQALANEKLKDRDFGFSVPVLALKRDVEYYQWVETSNEETQKLEGGREVTFTTYSYSSEWVDSPVPSTKFHDPLAHSRYKNTVLLNLKELTLYAREATLGAYRLPRFLIEDLPMDDLVDFSLSPAGKKSLADRMHTGISSVHVEDNTVYLGENPALPEIGDLRVSFSAAPEGEISILARVSGGTFEPYSASNGKIVFAAMPGNLSAQELYEKKETLNVIYTWLLRLLGVFLLCCAIRLLLGPLTILAGFVPFLGNLVDAGSFLVSIALGLALSLAVIAIAWLSYRPIIACGLLVFGFLFAVLLSFRKKLPYPV